MDMRLHVLVPIWLEGSYKVRFIFKAKISEDKMETDITSWVAFMRTVPIRTIEARISLFMTCKKRPECINYCTFPCVVWAYQNI
ncbi:hypothetical protein ASU64_06910 [Enterobacter hormaechei subsp. hoffmannii]|nr:hypothetical protein ASU64_06910 [Enterobacter hormaechei subsp. hoffmannii]